MTVVFAFLSLLYDLLKPFILALRQVFLFCLGHFLPKGSVILAKDKHWYHQCN